MGGVSRRAILGGTAGVVGGALGVAAGGSPAAATAGASAANSTSPTTPASGPTAGEPTTGQPTAGADGATAGRIGPSARRRWAACWATAQTAPTPTDADAIAGFTDTTIRSTLRLSAGGTTVRLRFANPFGTTPVVIGPVTANAKPVLFGGEKDVVLAAGATIVSDPVYVAVPDGGDLVVSMYLPGPTGPISFHRNVHATGYIGNRPTNSVFLLNGVDVEAPGRSVIAVLGDSITEGVGTPDNANLRWPDQYAARFRRRPAIANLGISGNRVLLTDARFGPSGQSRFDRDVLSLPNVHTLVLFLGINDIQQPPSQTDPERLLQGYDQLVRRAHDHDLEVVGATIGPFKGWIRYTDELDQVRNDVNAVLRQGHVFDRLLDVDAALRDPADQARLRPGFDSGDGLHPNQAGAKAIALAL
ncbi:GDSL-type esterase/lipase family protein [Kribbella shirazensis]|uniref:Lysophospholipase L1-like esterase n=1 Tax=Kribbella shirazensis TaxID=1105143 RepID=A0A7X5V857_9ACTN|nr:GDSL-type esterase/lipase family protein [Kribbella shirazensis]NIK56395.1 lysophospholipase L1-like esterase [Kribbella shirazensis]